METDPLALGWFNQALLFPWNWVYTGRFKKVQSRLSIAEIFKTAQLTEWKGEARWSSMLTRKKSGKLLMRKRGKWEVLWAQRRIYIIWGRRHLCSNGRWRFTEHLFYTKGCAEHFTFSVALNYQTKDAVLIFLFWGGCTLAACRTLVPQLGTELVPPALEGRFLTVGPPGKSLIFQLRKWSLNCLDS